MSVALIWAQADNGVIGDAGGIPWRLPEDQARFKSLTMGATVLMGRLTWESLPPSVRPLPGRRNLVLTSDERWTADGAERMSSLDAAVAATTGDLWVVGGAAVYAAALPLADRLEVTYVDLCCPGDVYAPPIDATWQQSADLGWQTSASGLRFKCATFVRPAAIPSSGTAPA
ncbi:MAG TPA: dihydrofolate reductase [Mycobacteriales bacterium]|nr:dihydrofolate reductase [Mycobacteriales bacterium]